VAPVLQKKYSKISNPGHPECYFLQVFD
jgi:hypothetical protein